MPSRRQFLAGAAGAAGVAVVGVAATGTELRRGHVWQKWIQGTDGDVRGTRYAVRLDSDGEPFRFDPYDPDDPPYDYDELFDDPMKPVVTDDALETLEGRYSDLAFGIGICTAEDGSDGCRNTWTSRNDFNSVQVTDEVTALLRDGRYRVVRVR